MRALIRPVAMVSFAFAIGWGGATVVLAPRGSDISILVRARDAELLVSIDGLDSSNRVWFRSEMLRRVIALGDGWMLAPAGECSRVGAGSSCLDYRIRVDPAVRKQLQVRATSGGFLVDPSSILPTIEGRVDSLDLTTLVTSRSGAVASYSWSPRQPLVYVGEAAATCTLGSGCLIAASTPSMGSRGMTAILQTQEALSRSLDDGGTSSGRTLKFWILIDRNSVDAADRRLFASSPERCVLLDPIEPDSPILARMLAMRALDDSKGAPQGVSAMATRAAEADELCVRVLGGASIYGRPWIQDLALSTLSEIGIEGISDPDSIDVPDGFRRTLATYVLGAIEPGERARLEISPGEADARKWRRRALFEWLSPRLRTSPVSAARQGDAAAIAARTFLIFGAFDGVVEECGCIASRARGGLLRLEAEIGRLRSRDSIVCCLGGMFAPPSSSANSPAHSKLVKRILDACAPDVFVPGTSELLACAIGDSSVMDLFRAHPPIACNLRRGDMIAARSFLDIRGSDTRVTRIIGVVGTRIGAISGLDRELIESRFGVSDAVSAVSRVLADTPISSDVVIVGDLVPNDVAAIGEIRRVQVISSCGTYPRIDGGSVVAGTPSGWVGDSSLLSCVLSYSNFVEATSDPVSGVRGQSRDLTAPIDFSSPLARESSDLLADGAGVASDRRARSGVRPAVEDPVQGGYVGSSACASCHDAEYKSWAGTPHAHAMDTLRKVQRHRVPTCVSCHVVGDADRSGYDTTSPDFRLENVGCEVCHGPGTRHVASPRVVGSIVRSPAPGICVECHSLEHSSLLLGRADEYFDKVRHR